MDLAEIKGVECATVLESNEEKIYNNVDLSPRVIKSDRKDKKQGDGESAQPLKVQLKK